MENFTGISKERRDRFVLSEEKLRKLNSIIREYHTNKGIPCNIFFLIIKKNDVFIRTEIIEDILKETNSKTEEIVGLVISAKSKIKRKEEETVKIKFIKRQNSISLDVYSEDRDWAMLIISDIENTLNSICEKKGFYGFMSKSIIDVIAYFILLALPMVILYHHWVKNIDKRKLSLVNDITTMSLDEKLVRIYFNDSTPIIFGGMLGIMISVVLSNIFFEKKLITTFFKKINSSFFVWGDEKSRYDRFTITESNIKWVIIIGGAVSIITSVLVTRIF